VIEAMNEFSPGNLLVAKNLWNREHSRGGHTGSLKDPFPFSG
jgi:hypothetical protein